MKLRQFQVVTIVPAEKFGTITPLPTRTNPAITRVVGAFTITLDSCKILGGEVICEFIVNNDSAESKKFSLVREDYRARRRGLDVTKAVDTSGREFVGAEVGIGYSSPESYVVMPVTLTPNVPKTLSIKFKGILSREITSFSLIRMAVSENTNRVNLSSRLILQ